MRAAACLCRSILRGTEKSVPRSDRAYKAPGDPGKQYQRLATATVVVTAATAAEAGQKQDQISHSQQSLPPQPLLLPSSPQPLLLPQPPPQNSNRMIQMQLLPKIPLPQWLWPQELLQPQFVAVKSLIFSASTFYLCSIVCGGACQCFRKRLAIISGYSKI